MSTSSADPFVRLGSLSITDPHDLGQVVRQQRLRFIAEARQPLFLISQIQRSGGTLVSQLLDGHSELHVHPNELHVGRPNKYHWPALDLSLDPAALFDSVFERPLLEYAQLGFQKVSSAEANFDPDVRDRVLPFIFDLQLQKRIFCAHLRQSAVLSQRAILDSYITSYFNAWLDYQGLYRPPAQIRYWVSFAARLLAMPGNIERFLADYPDGKAMIVLRDPVSWFASARRHSNEYEEVSAAMSLWTGTHSVLLDGIRRHPRQFLVVRFEDLVSDPRRVMERVVSFLGIRFEECLLRPTFNGMPIPSDSSFGSKIGIDRTTLDRTYDVDAAAAKAIRQATDPVYAALSGCARECERLYRTGS